MPIYAFEAKSIQRYLLEGGKLVDLAGGSELVASLATEPDLNGGSADALEAVAKSAGLTISDKITTRTDLVFTRRAGGAFIALCSDAAGLVRFRALWILKLAHIVPSIAYAEAWSNENDISIGLKEIVARLPASRNFPPLTEDPINPFVKVSGRTGRAAIAFDHHREGEEIDRATRAKRRAAAHSDGAARRFLPADCAKTHVWPTQTDPEEGLDPAKLFPFLGRNRTVALIHADGNRVGDTVIRLSEALASAKDPDAALRFRQFSRAIAAATENAAKLAMAESVVPHAKKISQDIHVMPGRPVVLGGDDVTLILRADVALAFTKAFLCHFETQSKSEFAKLRDISPAFRNSLPEYLSAGAGIAFVKISQPFDRSHELAEQLAKDAKSRAKNLAEMPQFVGAAPPSLISFHRITTSSFNSYASIRETELASTYDNRKAALTLNPYSVKDGVMGVPSLAALENLMEFLELESVSAGAVREAMGKLVSEPSMAQKLISRWHEMLRKPQFKDQNLDAKFTELMKKFGQEPEGKNAKQAGFVKAGETIATPMLDALTLIAAKKLTS